MQLSATKTLSYLALGLIFFLLAQHSFAFEPRFEAEVRRLVAVRLRGFYTSIIDQLEDRARQIGEAPKAAEIAALRETIKHYPDDLPNIVFRETGAHRFRGEPTSTVKMGALDPQFFEGEFEGEVDSLRLVELTFIFPGERKVDGLETPTLELAREIMKRKQPGK
jgi:hypothetical protein